MAKYLILYGTKEFSFVQLSDAYRGMASFFSTPPLCQTWPVHCWTSQGSSPFIARTSVPSTAAA
ncbi:hypothetical protein P7K49_003536 [Saguinus oedipus]|uniref:GST N-terminal domain-containing protein n=1 Tax=Saguinus oedipus TaxID=9490 RepID=A0ABQ9W5C5_SAGOE|nr:hypothetical protein P7K49_003536 [Saguinus oedipus]